MRHVISVSLATFAFVSALSLSTTADAAGFGIRKAKLGPALASQFTGCQVYTFKSGPLANQSVSANGRAGGPPSYSPDVSKCPSNGFFVQWPPPASMGNN
ncbi:hypothetical protein QA639_35160 [Bradyrhizobium pachyrhizi]|uniref:hypothetical protein n=1 Tax=Bradyrhizobium pachyrhizi TaxID=280333 RepID=UPI0024B0577F|nr:hypothetical protein [Bradyrhizobium pachyrhizi]WFU54769.1 hypothetical protein QA639_35160 [Bradyrhizobium pachyrhizi]